MRLSEYIRRWQLTGTVPEEGGTEFAFWAGWLTAAANQDLQKSIEEARTMAIRAAEFIESQK